MKKSDKIIIILIAAVIIISNLPPITYFLQEGFEYQNKDGSFKFSEQSGPTQGFDVALARFESFKKHNPENLNKILYRTFSLKPWRFWEWWNMISHFERYRLPKYQPL
ncbi:hypothetical protein [Pedobacter frigidisoli]|uniref:hypothetical protein n=1 Tax=Pedobacter frigidisoli TaxID=2530455 RepID=UPI002931B4A8|nr:hypothetical protein [Pedobacter frigidisoli]